MQTREIDGQLILFVLEASDEISVKTPKRKAPPKPISILISIPYFHLDLSKDHVNLFGSHYWEFLSPWRENGMPFNTGVAPREPLKSALSESLECCPNSKYYLSRTACLGILRRAKEREKELPPQLEWALMVQAGLIPPGRNTSTTEFKAYHINQRDEGNDLHGISGALMATDNPWDTQQTRIFTPEGKAPALAEVDGGGGRNPAGLLFAAGFCAGAAPTAGGIGYQEEVAPTLKAAESGTNMVPSILCLNDQGGSVMDCTEDVTGTLRAQEHGHQPLVFENHGIDARYTGPHPVSPTLSARAGTGGNNLPIVTEDPCYCITGNAIDRQPQNGGNGIGYQEGIAYTLTATDHHAVYSRQRVDAFKDDSIASTESARQHKDATDLVRQLAYQETVGALTSSDRKGPNSQYVGQDKLVVDGPFLIRRLTPLECERLQGFPDGWTDMPGASDSSRYKALGNSVAIPCVEYIMCGIAMAVGA